MSPRVSTALASLSALVIIVAAATYVATGAEVFTKLPSEELEKAQQDDEVGALFQETGLEDQHSEMSRVESRFALGLLPSGPGAGALSVATIGLPAAIVGGVALWIRFRKRAPSPTMNSQESA